MTPTVTHESIAKTGLYYCTRFGVCACLHHPPRFAGIGTYNSSHEFRSSHACVFVLLFTQPSARLFYIHMRIVIISRRNSIKADGCLIPKTAKGT